MPAAPDHVAVRFIAENSDIAPPDQIRQGFQIVLGGHAAGRVMRRVEKDGPGMRRLVHEPLHIIQIGAELILLPQRTIDRLGAAPLNVGAVRREMRTEDKNGISRIEKRLAEELFEHLGAAADHDILRPHRDSEFALIIGGDCLAKRRQAGRGAVVRGVAVDGLDAGGAGVLGTGEGTVADLEFNDILPLGLDEAVVADRRDG